MQRRRFIADSLAASAIGLFAATPARPAAAAAADTAPPPRLPQHRTVRVAFLLNQNANVIDTAGPWEVFQDVAIPEGSEIRGFELYTVAPERGVLRMTGGLQVQPDHSVDDAPLPQVVVVPAQKGDPRSLAWLKRVVPQTDVTMSVCTGAFQLGRAGLLDGLRATTHHQFFDKFAAEFPKVELQRGLRFVDNGHIATAGGLTSGIDMALHVVARYCGVDAAAATARYMEYTSEAWRA